MVTSGDRSPRGLFGRLAQGSHPFAAVVSIRENMVDQEPASGKNPFDLLAPEWPPRSFRFQAEGFAAGAGPPTWLRGGGRLESRPEGAGGDGGAFDLAAQLLGLGEAVELVECVLLDLADSLARDTELAPDLIQRATRLTV